MEIPVCTVELEMGRNRPHQLKKAGFLHCEGQILIPLFCKVGIRAQGELHPLCYNAQIPWAQIKHRFWMHNNLASLRQPHAADRVAPWNHLLVQDRIFSAGLILHILGLQGLWRLKPRFRNQFEVVQGSDQQYPASWHSNSWLKVPLFRRKDVGACSRKAGPCSLSSCFCGLRLTGGISPAFNCLPCSPSRSRGLHKQILWVRQSLFCLIQQTNKGSWCQACVHCLHHIWMIVDDFRM